MKKMKIGSLLAILISAAILLSTSCSVDQAEAYVEPVQQQEAKPAKKASPAKKATSQRQKSALSFTLNTLEGESVSLDDYKGKLVMINFWAHWCGPCIHEIPDLVKLRNTYKDRGFEILGIVVPSGVNEKKILEAQTRLGINYPILMGDIPTIEKFGQIYSIPTTFLINQNGKVVDRVIGARPYAVFEKMITPHLPGS